MSNLRADAAMNNLSSILTVVVAVAFAGIAYLWRRVSALEGRLRQERKSLAELSSQAERSALQAKQKATELERTKKQLHETRAKMKRQQKESNSGSGKRNRSAEPDSSPAPSQDSFAAVVHVSNQELEARFSEKLALLEADLQAERERVRALEAAATQRDREAETARKALQKDTPTSGTAEEQLAELEKGFEAFRQDAEAQQRKLKKAAARAEAKERAAARRANNNHSLYLVIKGQLELAEDKVALFRRRYEGAKTPDEVRAEAEPEVPKSEVSKSEVSPTEPPPSPSTEPASESEGNAVQDPPMMNPTSEPDASSESSDRPSDERPKEPAEA